MSKNNDNIIPLKKKEEINEVELNEYRIILSKRQYIAYFKGSLSELENILSKRYSNNVQVVLRFFDAYKFVKIT